MQWSINTPIVYIACKLRTRNDTIPHMGVRIRSVHETPTPPIVNPFRPESKLAQPYQPPYSIPRMGNLSYCALN